VALGSKKKSAKILHYDSPSAASSYYCYIIRNEKIIRTILLPQRRVVIAIIGRVVIDIPHSARPVRAVQTFGDGYLNWCV
jgi:hypothetical protein